MQLYMTSFVKVSMLVLFFSIILLHIPIRHECMHLPLHILVMHASIKILFFFKTEQLWGVFEIEVTSWSSTRFTKVLTFFHSFPTYILESNSVDDQDFICINLQLRTQESSWWRFTSTKYKWTGSTGKSNREVIEADKIQKGQLYVIAQCYFLLKLDLYVLFCLFKRKRKIEEVPLYSIVSLIHLNSPFQI